MFNLKNDIFLNIVLGTIFGSISGVMFGSMLNNNINEKEIIIPIYGVRINEKEIISNQEDIMLPFIIVVFFGLSIISIFALFLINNPLILCKIEDKFKSLKNKITKSKASNTKKTKEIKKLSLIK